MSFRFPVNARRCSRKQVYQILSVSVPEEPIRVFSVGSDRVHPTFVVKEAGLCAAVCKSYHQRLLLNPSPPLSYIIYLCGSLCLQPLILTTCRANHRPLLTVKMNAGLRTFSFGFTLQTLMSLGQLLFLNRNLEFHLRMKTLRYLPKPGLWNEPTNKSGRLRVKNSQCVLPAFTETIADISDVSAA